MENKLELRCTTCGEKCGEYTLSDSTDPTGLTLADFDIVDVRCDKHKP